MTRKEDKVQRSKEQLLEWATANHPEEMEAAGDQFNRRVFVASKLWARQARKATCGACGSERVVDYRMKRNLEAQFTARPTEETDSFYCGCQNEEPEMDGLDPGTGYD